MKMKYISSLELLMIALVIQQMYVTCERALIFKQKYGAIVAVDSSDPNSNCEFCAAACPAWSESDSIFNFEISITGKSSIVKKVFTDVVNFDKTNFDICNRPYKSSIIFDAVLMRFELGYEVYYDKEEFNKFLAPDDYLEYESVTDGITRIRAKLAGKPLPLRINEEKKLVSLERRVLDFIWIPVFTLEFDITLINPIIVEYQKKLYIEQLVMEKCGDYDLGKELYGDIDVNQLYTEETQKKMFSYKRIPSSSQPKNSHLLRCGHDYGCFVKTPLVPDYYLESDSAVRAYCSNALTIPVWETIANGPLKKVDQYLFTISQLWKPNIYIYSGTFEILQLPYYTIFFKPTDTFLDISSNRIPVPRILYKVVRLEMRLDTGYVDHLLAIIVIHNDPISLSNRIVRFCSKEVELSGWDAITSWNRDSGHVYVCPMDRNIFKKLNMNLNADDMLYLPPLILDKFPYSTIAEGFPSYDQRDRINGEWKKLFPELPAAETNSSV